MRVEARSGGSEDASTETVSPDYFDIVDARSVELRGRELWYRRHGRPNESETTTATSMQIPPGVLTVGESYAVKIRAIIQPLPESAPYRKGFPDAQSVVLSSRFVP